MTALEALRTLRADLIAMEPGSRFMGIPDRWYEEPGPLFRCTGGHVSSCVLRSEQRGDLCLECGSLVLMTFPEDVDDPSACEDCDGDGKVRDPAPDAPGALPTTRCLTCTGGAS